MPRSRGGAGPARAPARPQAPSRPAPPPQAQQQRPMSTAPTAQQHAPPAQAQSPGLFGQMASTAAGVAVGSSIGHAIGGFFGGGSSAPAEQAPAQQPIDNYSAGSNSMYNTNAQSTQASGPCATDITRFSDCMSQNRGDLNICGWYLEQLKACQAAASQY